MYLTFTEPGIFLGLTGARLVAYKDRAVFRQFPLTKIKFIVIESKGISFSSDLVISCAERGIQIFVTNFKGEALTALYGLHHHATSRIREKQFEFIKNKESFVLCKNIIYAKIRNQRSLLLYFSKYLQKKNETEKVQLITESCEKIMNIAESLKNMEFCEDKNMVLGYEGSSARIYWQALKDSCLLSDSFEKRNGRGSDEINNVMLNYGYAILSSHIWRAMQNAGLEIYAGFLHEKRPGKPSLVLDDMEVYRAWVVDRAVIKLSHQYSEFSHLCKKSLVEDIHKTMQKQFHYHGKKVKLEAIIQRQVYRLAGKFCGNGKYKPYLFRW